MVLTVLVLKVCEPVGNQLNSDVSLIVDLTLFIILETNAIDLKSA